MRLKRKKSPREAVQRLPAAAAVQVLAQQRAIMEARMLSPCVASAMGRSSAAAVTTAAAATSAAAMSRFGHRTAEAANAEA